MSDEIKPIEVEVEETDSKTGGEQAPEVLALDFTELSKNFFESAKSLGQIVWVDKDSDSSNTIKVVRMLSTGERQMFTITLSEVNEISMSK